MKSVILLSIFCGLVACAPKQDDSRTAKPTGGGKTDGPQKPAGTLKNTTDYKVCGDAPSTLTTPEGRWEMTESADNFYFKITLNFSNGKLTLRQDCYHAAHRLISQVTVPASYGQGIIKVLDDASDVQKAVDKQGTFECKVSLAQGTSNYGFAGHCLELRFFQGRPYLKFVPQ